MERKTGLNGSLMLFSKCPQEEINTEPEKRCSTILSDEASRNIENVKERFPHVFDLLLRPTERRVMFHLTLPRSANGLSIVSMSPSPLHANAKAAESSKPAKVFLNMASPHFKICDSGKKLTVVVTRKTFMEELFRLYNENAKLLGAVDQYKVEMEKHVNRGKAAERVWTFSASQRIELIEKGRAAAEEYKKATKDREELLKSKMKLESLVKERW
ncbi:hypothetical protein IWZ03DRAFT_363150 [Phyllosticta citriasiana]|uniref:Uncharacterized protein n=1 Tax=Phyllosticta citriasiana TaxID=595635 RepID=A0ABR1KDX3_9PEZI